MLSSLLRKMKPVKQRSYPNIPDHLFSIITTEFDPSSRACELFEDFFRLKVYSRSFAIKLIEAARGAAGDSWDVRRLATLMLEHQVLKLAAGDTEEFDFLLTELHLKPAQGADFKVNDSVLKEGYSATDLRGFTKAFRRKLERHNRIHARIKREKRTTSALRDFIDLSRRDCKLSLARYLFQPDEVVDRILGQVKTSMGVTDLAYQHSIIEREVKLAVDRLPRYEARILERLCEGSAIYWVAEKTSSDINALVEYPLTTVVLVIKPPGSDIEFEIKRAGRRGLNPLGVIYYEDDYVAPAPHRLDGGSMQHFLRKEAMAASFLSGVYRLAHAQEAPIPKYISRATIFNIPVEYGEENIISYYTNPEAFGKGFSQMRTAMRESVEAFKDEVGASLSTVTEDLGLTIRFLNHTVPAQSIMYHTSSFRLDKLAEYLSGDGAKIYFKQYKKAEYSNRDARRFADEVLEEILGVYKPPKIKFQNYGQYLDEAFSVEENRERADRNYLSVIKQLGVFWGTLLAVRASSHGESFVARNVGLKSFWENDRWKVKIIFMDHDNLQISNHRSGSYSPHQAIVGASTDERYILGGSDDKQYHKGSVECLREIYRVGKRVRQKGKTVLRDSMRSGYRITHDRMAEDEGFLEFYNRAFVERIRDWDAVVASYIKAKDKGKRLNGWGRKMKGFLADKGYSERVIERYLNTVKIDSEWLERYSFLFNGK